MWKVRQACSDHEVMVPANEMETDITSGSEFIVLQDLPIISLIFCLLTVLVFMLPR